MFGHMKIVDKYPLYFKIIFHSWTSILFLPLKAVLAFLYGVVVMCRGMLLKRSVSREGKTLKLSIQSGRMPRIISVGNIEVGGTGKTPISLKIAEELISAGKRVVIVMRGYGRRGKDPLVVPSQPTEYSRDLEREIAVLSPDEGFSRRIVELIGDEAAIYRRRRVPLVIDADRMRGIKTAVKFFKSSHIILDDAFQNGNVYRDLDIVLVDYSNPLGNGWLLPLGRLREPPSALKRADVVIATRAIGSGFPGAIRKFVEGKNLFNARFRSDSLVGVDWHEIPLAEMSGRKAVIFSAVARPGSFENDCIKSGLNVSMSIRYIDHHRYTPEDVNEIIAASNREDVFFVTTEKDIQKIADIFPLKKRLFALKLEVEIDRIGELVKLCLG